MLRKITSVLLIANVNARYVEDSLLQANFADTPEMVDNIADMDVDQMYTKEVSPEDRMAWLKALHHQIQTIDNSINGTNGSK